MLILNTEIKIDANDETEYYKIIDKTSNSIKLDNNIKLNQRKQQNTSNCFIYGTNINDFHTLNKDYIFTLNVSATQELYKIIQQQQEQINKLIIEVENLKNNYSSSSINWHLTLGSLSSSSSLSSIKS